MRIKKLAWRENTYDSELLIARCAVGSYDVMCILSDWEAWRGGKIIGQFKSCQEAIDACNADCENRVRSMIDVGE